jgi:hypothetical protein
VEGESRIAWDHDMGYRIRRYCMYCIELILAMSRCMVLPCLLGSHSPTVPLADWVASGVQPLRRPRLLLLYCTPGTRISGWKVY